MRLKRGGKGAGKEQEADEDESGLREHVEETVGDISGKDSGGVGAASEADCKTRGVSPDDGRKKECGEEPPGVTLRAGREIKFASGGVDDHAPLGDADQMGQEIGEQDGEEASKRNALDGCQEQRKREKMKEDSENGDGGQPAKSSE